jgi:hypothetical protein
MSFAHTFIAQGQATTLRSRARHVTPGWLNPYIVGHYRLEVVNDIFNDMGMSCLVILPHRTQSAAWRRAVRSLDTVAVSCEWSTWSVLHCSCLFICLAGINCATCTHVLPGHDGSDVMRLGNMCTCVGNMRP